MLRASSINIRITAWHWPV